MPRKLTKILLTICLLVWVLPVISQAKEKRVALILGNGVYPYPNALKNPAADAYDLEQALKQLGFEVISGVNINKQQTEKLIEQFGKRLAKTRGVGLFYFSGFGFQSAGENFLVPVDASFDDEARLVESSVPLGSIMAKFKAAKAKTNIILLDATVKSVFQTFGQIPISISTKNGFAKVPAADGTLVFYSSENGKPSSESCRRNGLFVASFLHQLENPLLDFSQLTEKVSAEVREQTAEGQKPFTEGNLKKSFYFAKAKLRFKPEPSKLRFKPDPVMLGALYDKFKVAGKKACGQREEAICVGLEILEKYPGDQDNQEVIRYVKNETEKIQKEEPICRGNDIYNAAYKAKDWVKFISISKDLIAREGNSPLALDIMLTLVSVGFDQAVAKNDRYNDDTINYAKQALQRIEAGGTSSTGRWGVYLPFKTTIYPDGKANALNVLNYMIGWINANRPNGNKKEGLSYLYKSTLYKGEFRSDFTLYTTIGDFYFTEAVRLDKEYRDIRAAKENKETDEAKAKRALARGYADRGIDAFGRAYKIAQQNKSTPKVLEALRKTLNDLYRFRFNVPPEQPIKDTQIYFEQLISRPMPNPETPVEPVLN